MARSHLRSVPKNTYRIHLSIRHGRLLRRCRPDSGSIRAEDSRLRSQIGSVNLFGESHYRCGSVWLLLGLLFIASFQELPAQVVSANQISDRDNALSPGVRKTAFNKPSRNDSGVMGAPSKDSLEKCLAIQQILATTLVVQRPLDSTPVVPTKKMTPDVVIRTKRPPPAPTTPGVPRYGLTRGDFENIEKLVPSLAVAVPFRAVTQSARYADREQEVAVVGTTAKASQTDEIVIRSGRFLNKRDVEYRNNVAVITADIANRVFRDKNPIGRNLRVNDDYFLIVGVIEMKKRSLQTSKPSNALRIYIPITTMNSRFGDQVLSRKSGSFLVEAYELSEIHLVLNNRDEIPIAVKKIRRLLGLTHETADYTVDVLKQ